MKLNTLIVGLIALIMLAVPVMAIDSTPIAATGSITQSLTITNTQSALNFNPLIGGDNEKDNVGTLTVDAAWTGWTVTTATTGTPNNDGWMYNKGGSGPGYLVNPLEQYNYNTNTWSNVKAFTFSGVKTAGPSSTPMSESFRQKVTTADVPGDYAVNVVYTVSAA